MKEDIAVPESVNRSLVTLVRVAGDNTHGGKKMWLDEAGGIQKEPGTPIVFATATVQEVPDQEAFIEVLREVGEDESLCLILGYPVGIEPGHDFYICSTQYMTEELGGNPHEGFENENGKFICRLKRNFMQSSWIVFDKDDVDGMPDELKTDSKDEWWDNQMCKLLPALKDVGVIFTSSNSCRVLKGGKPFKVGNYHAYVQVVDAEDAGRFGFALFQYSQSGSYGFKKKIKNGEIRATIFDHSTFSRERLLYEGKPSVELPLDVADLEIVARPGGWLDTTVVKIDNEKSEDVKIRKTRSGGYELEQENVLTWDMEIETKDHGVMTIREYYEKFDEKLRIQSPFRPESTSWAAFVNKHKTGMHAPFVYDIGTRTKYLLKRHKLPQYERGQNDNPDAESNPREKPFPVLTQPEPLALQHEAFVGRVPEPVVPELLYPVEMGFSGYVLQSRFLTPLAGRCPNLMSIALGNSTAGKDTHSQDIIYQLRERFSKDSDAWDFLTGATSSGGTITSDTALHKAIASNDGNLFWLLTEATYMVSRIANATNPSVAAIAEKLKSAYDGLQIKTQQKADEKVEVIYKPNVSVVWYGQPDNFFGDLTAEMLSSGFAGRFDYYIFDGSKIKRRSMWGSSKNDTYSPKEFPPEYCKYIEYVIRVCAKVPDGKHMRVHLDEKAARMIGDWEEQLDTNVDPELEIFTNRISMSAEKILTIQAAHEFLWERFKVGDQDPFGNKQKPKICRAQIENILPWVEHQYHIRKNIVYSRIGENVHKMREAKFLELMREVLQNPEILRKQGNYGKGSAIEKAKDGKVALGYIKTRLRKIKKLNFDSAAARNAFFDALEKEGRIIKENYGGGEYISLNSSY